MKQTLFIILAFCSLSVFPQGNPDYWPISTYWDMDFSAGNSGVPSINLESFGINTLAAEGMANGKLLLTYSIGNSITGTPHGLLDPFKKRQSVDYLAGSSFGFQSVLIVPHPQSIYKYYLFSNTNGFLSNENLVVFEFDYRLNSGAGGLVSTNPLILDNSVENVKMIAFFDETDNSYWIVNQRKASDEFVSFKIDQNGINTTPVISPVALSYAFNAFFTGQDGQAVISRQGNKIAIASPTNRGLLHLYDFDKNTGVVSNRRSIGSVLNDKEAYYGVAFSPDGTKLYASTYGDFPFINSPISQTNTLVSRIHQFDLSLSTTSQILSSVVTVSDDLDPEGLPPTHGFLHLGADKKIYIAPFPRVFSLTVNNVRRNPWLSIIRNPNELGLSSDFMLDYFIMFAVNPPASYSFLFPNRISNTIINEIKVGKQCLGSATEFSLTENVSQVLWNFDDPNSGANNTSNSLTPSHQFTSTGKYRVTANVIVNGLAKEYVRYIRIFDPPLLFNMIEPLDGCDEDGNGFASFDLNRIPPLISNQYLGENFSYYLTMQDAIDRVNPLATDVDYVNIDPFFQDIYVLVDNRYGCSNIILVPLITDRLSPIPPDFTFDMVNCRQPNEVSSVFDLTTVQESLSSFYSNSNVDTNSFIYEYYRNEANALNATNPIVGPRNYEINFINNETIYVRVIHPDTFCDYVAPVILLNIVDTPTIETELNLVACDQNNSGLGVFDTSLLESLIVNDSAGISISYYDLNDNFLFDQVPNPYSSASDIINYVVTYTGPEGLECSVDGMLSLDVIGASSSANTLTLYGCEIENRTAIFDLTNIREQLGINPVLSVAFFDAAGNSLGSNLGADFQTASQTITVVASLGNDVNCREEFQVEFVVFEKPAVNLLDRYELCVDEVLNLDLGTSFDSVNWSNGSNTAQTQYNTTGLQSVTVSNVSNGIECSYTFEFEIVALPLPVIEALHIDFSARSVTVQMVTPGNYIYEIPNINSQSSNVFDNLEYGEYEVSVREVPDCGTDTKFFNIIGYPRFFTPNQDGFNDRWNMLGVKSNEVYIISIFDRYGKLLKRIESDKDGWDGTYNGNPMPSSDYWFKAVKNDMVEFQGHFTLKR